MCFESFATDILFGVVHTTLFLAKEANLILLLGRIWNTEAVNLLVSLGFV